jgi:hypothetical protein
MLAGPTPPTGRGPTGVAIRTCELCWIDDIASDKQFQQWQGEALRRGYPAAAKAGQLLIVAAGAPASFDLCRPLIDSLGQRTFVVCAEPSHANLVKLLGNMMTATPPEVLGEVNNVALRRELDAKAFVDIMTDAMLSGRA